MCQDNIDCLFENKQIELFKELEFCKNLIYMVMDLLASKNSIYYQAISNECYEFLDDMGALDLGGIKDIYEVFNIL